MSKVLVRNVTNTSILGSKVQGENLSKLILDTINRDAEVEVDFAGITNMAIEPVLAAFKPFIDDFGKEVIGTLIKITAPGNMLKDMNRVLGVS